MAKKSHIKVRMVPESNPDSKFIYYAKKPTKGEKVKDKEINIKNFATFRIINKGDRIGRNPKNKKIYKIKARKSLSFAISKKFNDKIKDL